MGLGSYSYKHSGDEDKDNEKLIEQQLQIAIKTIELKKILDKTKKLRYENRRI